MNWKVVTGFAVLGALISLVAGMAGGNPFGIVLLRLVLSAFVFALLGAGVVLTLGRFVPELLGRAPAPAEPGAVGEDVDIVIDEEIPLNGESLLDQGPPPVERAELGGLGESAGSGAGALTGRPLGADRLGPDEEVPDLEAPSDAEVGDGFGVLEGEPPSPEPLGAEASWNSPGEDIGALDSLPELEQPSSAAEGPEAGRTAGRRTGGKLEESVAGQDPASLAKAVRTFLRKDQEG